MEPIFVNCYGRILRTTQEQLRRLLSALAGGEKIDPAEYGEWHLMIDFHLSHIDKEEAGYLLEELH